MLLGRPAREIVPDADQIHLEAGLRAALQSGAEERAVHLDIETDDVEAEVARLEKLGARVKARIRNHVVMISPTGHAFCVVPVHRGDFDGLATEWQGPDVSA